MKKIFFLSVFGFAPFAWSGAILQPQTYGAFNIGEYGPVGQTFTAEDSRISTIGFDVENPVLNGPPSELTFSLMAGAGIDGLPVATTSVPLSPNFNGFAEADFSSVKLTVGQVYTVLISEPTHDYLVYYNVFSDSQGPIPGRIDYTGGEEIEQGQLQPNADLTFRIEPIPEPGVMGLWVMGFLGLGARFNSKFKIQN